MRRKKLSTHAKILDAFVEKWYRQYGFTGLIPISCRKVTREIHTGRQWSMRNADPDPGGKNQQKFAKKVLKN